MYSHRALLLLGNKYTCDIICKWIFVVHALGILHSPNICALGVWKMLLSDIFHLLTAAIYINIFFTCTTEIAIFLVIYCEQPWNQCEVVQFDNVLLPLRRLVNAKPPEHGLQIFIRWYYHLVWEVNCYELDGVGGCQKASSITHS